METTKNQQKKSTFLQIFKLLYFAHYIVCNTKTNVVIDELKMTLLQKTWFREPQPKDFECLNLKIAFGDIRFARNDDKNSK